MYSSNVLFYSNKCNYSRSILNDANNIKDLVKICVDNNRNVPNGIKSVPTIVTKTGAMMCGNDVKKWIMYKIQCILNPNYLNDLMKKKQSSQQNVQNNNNNNSVSDDSGVMAFHQTEMGGYSDPYSYISDDGKAEPLSHSFSFMGNTPNHNNNSGRNTNSSAPLPSESSSNTRVSKSAGLDDAFERLKEAREREMSQMKRI